MEPEDIMRFLHNIPKVGPTSDVTVWEVTGLTD